MLALIIFYLKSNMDRFIVPRQAERKFFFKDLKSNMDRFIGVEMNWGILIVIFKIQYG